MRNFLLLPILGSTLLVASGCATTLSSFQTARPTERKRVQVHGGVGGYVPLGQIARVVGIGYDQQQKAREAIARGETYEIDEQTANDLVTAGIALGTFPPSASYEMAIRTGILEENMDVGLRYSINALRLDTKFRFLHSAGGYQQDPNQRTSFDLALGLGYSHYFFSGPVFKALEFLKLDDFSRRDVEVPLYVSFEVGHVLKLYAVPKWVYSHTTFDGNLVSISRDVTIRSGVDVRLPEKVDSHFFGATAGIGLGYKYAHVFLELTGGYTTATPTIFNQKRELGGVTLYPAIGLVVNFGAEKGSEEAVEKPAS